MWALRRYSLAEFQNLDAVLSRWKKISISPRAILAVYTRARTHVWHNFFLKIDFFGTIHGDRPTSQIGISLRSPSLIMAPGK